MLYGRSACQNTTHPRGIRLIPSAFSASEVLISLLLSYSPHYPSPHRVQLCINYTGAIHGAGAARRRALLFREWCGGRSKGFACVCPRCALHRASPAVLKAEEEAEAAISLFLNPVEDVSWGWPKPPGAPKPADKVMSKKRRETRAALLRAQPPAGRAGLVPLLRLHAWSLARQGDIQDAAAAAREAADTADSLFGPLAASAYLTAVRLDAALFALAASPVSANTSADPSAEPSADLVELTARALRPVCSPPWGAGQDLGGFRADSEERAAVFGWLWSGGAGPPDTEAAAAAAAVAEGVRHWTADPAQWAKRMGALVEAAAAAERGCRSGSEGWGEH